MSLHQKTPFVKSLNAFAQRKALDEIEKRGQALPGRVVAVTGAIVTIAFEVSGVTLPQITLPLFGPEYIRYPIQVGDLGVTFPVDTYIGGVSGLGGGTADDTLRGNLSTLVWFPIGNKNWSTPPGSDANTLTLYGKTALALLDSIAGNGIIKLTANSITLAFATHSIIINSSGVTIDGKVFLSHEHSGVQSGGSNTGGVV